MDTNCCQKYKTLLLNFNNRDRHHYSGQFRLMKKKNRRGKNSDCYFQSDDETSQSQQMSVKEEEMQIQSQPQQSQTKQHMSKDIESMDRMEIFSIFCEAKNIRTIVQQNQQNYTLKNKFYWRIQYIFGEIIIMIQDYLISQNLLEHSLKMQVTDIRCICQKLIQQADKGETNLQFQEIKKQMLVLYRSNCLNYKIAIRMYNFLVKVWKIPVQFQLDFMKAKEKPLNQFQGVTYSNCTKEATNSSSKIVQQKTGTQSKQPIIPMINSPINILTTYSSPASHIPQSRIGPFSVTRMPVQSPNLMTRNPPHTNVNKSKERIQMMRNRPNTQKNISNSPINAQSYGYTFSDQILQRQRQISRRAMAESKNNTFCMKVSSSFENEKQKEMQISKNSISFGPAENDSLKKWSSKQEALLCQIYSKTDTALGCQQQLEDLLGVDPRWKNVSMIESKMFSLVNKVFNKFMTLQTKNESINIFKSNRRVIMECRNQHLRRCIFKQIAIIYISMLYVNQSKKQEISRRIIQVNKLSKRISQPQS